MYYDWCRACIRTRIGRKKIKQCLSVTSLDSKKPQYRVKLILAGRTNELGDKTFGIAIFEARDEAAARSCKPIPRSGAD
jgi:hypothetical protein